MDMVGLLCTSTLGDEYILNRHALFSCASSECPFSACASIRCGYSWNPPMSASRKVCIILLVTWKQYTCKKLSWKPLPRSCVAVQYAKMTPLGSWHHPIFNSPCWSNGAWNIQASKGFTPSKVLCGCHPQGLLDQYLHWYFIFFLSRYVSVCTLWIKSIAW